MSVKNQNEQLMHTAIAQIAAIALVIAGIWFYALPKYNELGQTVADANASIKTYADAEQNGLTYETLKSSLKTSGTNKELLSVVEDHPEESKKAIDKKESTPYLAWLRQNVANNSTKGDLAIEMKKLNSVVPTLSPVSNGVEQDPITLKKYVMFIEDKIIRAFNIESFNPIGIQSIRYGSKENGLPTTIGSFDSEISFTATNKDISALLEYVNGLGDTSILTSSGKISSMTAVPDVMTNPLVTIEEFALQQDLDLTKPNEKNTGRITLRFYVRGASEADITVLRNSVQDRNLKLKKSIDEALTLCNNPSNNCTRKRELTVLSKKYDEFSRANDTKSSEAGVGGIYTIGTKLDTIVSMEKELKSITGK